MSRQVTMDELDRRREINESFSNTHILLRHSNRCWFHSLCCWDHFTPPSVKSLLIFFHDHFFCLWNSP